MGDLTVSEVLSKAADLLEPEGAFTKGAYARDIFNADVDEDAPDAVCWCAIGALWLTSPTGKTTQEARRYLLEVTGQGITAWNDAPERTQAEVVAALREASKRASTPPNEPSAAMGGGGGG